MHKIVLSLIIGILGFGATQVVNFENNWAQNPLFTVVSQSPTGVEVIFSTHQVVVEDVLVDGEVMKSYGVPGIFLFNDAGAPNLAGTGRYIAIPQGAEARVEILDARTETHHNVLIAPAPQIPLENDDSPLRYEKDMSIYSKNAYYPASPVRLSKHMKIRGVDVVILGVTPFQYNPITKDLIIYKDLRIRVSFVGGNGHFGVDRLRSRFWEPILQGNLLNYSSLPRIDFYAPERIQARAGYEYIIIVPDDPVFEAWGDTIKAWRKLQGISCEVFTLTEVGGSSAAAIENFLDNAYNTWDPAPVAFLLLSDYPSSGDVYGITSPVWNSYCVSDNIYADVDGDDLPDMDHGRICAQTETQLGIMINKFLSYERNPYTAANFYDEPLVACAWQTERWFQLCGEVVRGFLINGLGKNPARQYKIYSGTPTPGGAWSTATNTSTVVNYWYNVGWLPSTTNPYDQTWWNNGSASGITNAINSGAFLVQHRDHGAETGWGEPAYHNSDLDNLTNDMFCFVYSTNCLTGKYNSSSEVFTEKFHRITHGALGLNAASEISYSFVNDTYVWGTYDCLWPEFDPGYPAFDITGYDNLRPCQAMTYGKYYLQASSWPYNSSNKVHTYHLFHHHGDCFITLYSEIPQNLSVSHAPTLPAGQTYFTVTANDSSVIALTVAGEIIGVAEGTGSPVNITIPAQTPGTIVKVTVTKANYYRYEADVQVVSSSYPYVTLSTDIIDDSAGNNDGVVNPGETINYGVYGKNVGGDDAYSVYGLLAASDPYVSISIDSAWYGDIPQNDSALSNPYYRFTVATDCPDGHNLNLTIYFHDINDSVFTSFPSITVAAPALSYQDHSVVGGNNNGILDPGETANLVVTLKNDGGATAYDVTSTLITSSPYITINDASGNYGTIASGNSGNNSADPYNVTADASTPQGTEANFGIVVHSGFYTDTLNFTLTIGLLPGTIIWGPKPLANIPSSGFVYGLAYDPVGDQLFVCDFYSRLIRIYSSDSFVNYLGSFTAPDTCGCDIAYCPSDDKLWFTAKNQKQVWKIDKNGNILSQFANPANDYPVGLAWDGQNLWLPDRRTNAGDTKYIYIGDTLGSFTQYNNPIQGYYSARCIAYDSLGHSFPHVQTFFNSGGTALDSAGVYEIQGIPPTWTGNKFLVQDGWNIRGIEFDPRDGNYWITIPQISGSGVQEIVKVAGFYTPPIGVQEDNKIPGITSTQMAIYPTVSQDAIRIQFQTIKKQPSIIKIYNTTGQLIKKMTFKTSSARFTWYGDDLKGRNVPAGIYFIRFETNDYNQVEKVILLK